MKGVDCWREAALDNSVAHIEIRDGALVVEWADGQVCEFEARYLRLNCGCAECVEEWSRRKLLDPAAVDADLRAEDYLLVGQYAVQILWSDAHFTGIYPLRPPAQAVQMRRVRGVPHPSHRGPVGAGLAAATSVP